MIKIHKVFLKNFKGISTAKVIDFSDAMLTILDGPNGFGKTTIFDAIEICLRGKMERTVSYDHVTKKNADHKKPFYQNIKGQDVLLKLWLRDDANGSDHIIYKYLSAGHDGKVGTSKAFRPDAWGILSTYHENSAEGFETKEDLQGCQEVDQDFIDRLFFSSPDLSLVNLYPLFNYLQQEENIYFLKKDEEKKKNELDFLFQTQQDALRLEKIEAFLKNIRSCKNEISARILELGDISQVNGDLSYKKLIADSDLLFDQQHLFDQLSPENLVATYERVRSELQEITDFRASFDVIEFQKQKFRSSLSAVLNDRRLLKGFVLQNYFEEKALLAHRELRRVVESFGSYRKKLEDNSFSDADILAMGFDESYLLVIKRLIGQRRQLEGQIGQLGKIIVDLNGSREKVMVEAAQLNVRPDNQANCPLCDSSFGSLDELAAAVADKTALLTAMNQVQVTQLQQLNAEIKTSITDQIQGKITAFFARDDNKLDLVVAVEIEELKGVKEVIARFNKVLLENQVDLSSFTAGLQIDGEQFNLLQSRLTEDLRNRIESISVAEEKLVGSRMFTDLFREDKDKFAALTREDLSEKAQHLNQEFLRAKFTSSNILRGRLLAFEKVESKVARVQEVLDKAIKKYKMDMIEKIKIPFYIFSGKIIQNYQQGFGIFIDMNERTNRVRFLADCNSDHDIIHHLSSGQLAVVSIAFCLALNKVYNTTNNFKFLAIDDPVQTLDDINVHSFIELLRHDFKNFQILLSTHEESVASYMDYKFRKFGFETQRKRVQKILYAE